MKDIRVKAGDVVVTNFGVYQHWSLVSDLTCEEGMPMLISATKRNGTVKEEPWGVVTQGKHTYVANVSYPYSVSEVLKFARSKIDNWTYSVTSNNCEHFVNSVTKLKPSSKQVVAATSGAAIGAAFVGMCSENPKAVKFLGWSLAIAGLAVMLTKASEKKKSMGFRQWLISR